ncbi:hypothetical protein TNCT_642561 [Trichonephila clavata]|uniref:Uncharacterized protein n=1 Tax=Trichonephila clavata TaxID=2740835 RepID=A0A8X6HK43_TRICU|nr:hypothetical protein TNCT_642561 [Trichonephila clavata]
MDLQYGALNFTGTVFVAILVKRVRGEMIGESEFPKWVNISCPKHIISSLEGSKEPRSGKRGRCHDQSRQRHQQGRGPGEKSSEGKRRPGEKPLKDKKRTAEQVQVHQEELGQQMKDRADQDKSILGDNAL